LVFHGTRGPYPSPKVSELKRKMALLSESIAVGVLLMLIFGSAVIYLYSRITYTEKRLSMMESLLVDIKMMIESTEQGPPVLPVASVHAYQPPAFDTKVEAEAEAPQPEDESVYADVLQHAPTDVSGEAPPVTSPVEATAKLGPNYDAMTRTELVALVEQRGGRTTKRTGRGELINMLRTQDASKNEAAVSGDAVAEPVGGDLSVDTGSGTTNGSELEEATL
jgi:hypothetical protein